MFVLVLFCLLDDAVLLSRPEWDLLDLVWPGLFYNDVGYIKFILPFKLVGSSRFFLFFLISFMIVERSAKKESCLDAEAQRLLTQILECLECLLDFGEGSRPG